MIKIDWKGFIYSRVWFGYCRGNKWVEFGDDISGGAWEPCWVKVANTWPWWT